MKLMVSINYNSGRFLLHNDEDNVDDIDEHSRSERFNKFRRSPCVTNVLCIDDDLDYVKLMIYSNDRVIIIWIKYILYQLVIVEMIIAMVVMMMIIIMCCRSDLLNISEGAKLPKL